LAVARIFSTIDDMKRSTRSKPHTVVKVGNVTVKIYKRARETANGKSTREIFEIADRTQMFADCVNWSI